MKVQIALAVVAALFAWEVVVVDVDTPWRTSFVLERIAASLQTAFEAVGRFVAWVFYDLIDLRRIRLAALRVIDPLVDIATSGWWFALGIWRYSAEHAGKAWDYVWTDISRVFFVALTVALGIVLACSFAVIYGGSVFAWFMTTTVSRFFVGVDAPAPKPRPKPRTAASSRDVIGELHQDPRFTTE